MKKKKFILSAPRKFLWCLRLETKCLRNYTFFIPVVLAFISIIILMVLRNIIHNNIFNFNNPIPYSDICSNVSNSITIFLVIVGVMHLISKDGLITEKRRKIMKKSILNHIDDNLFIEDTTNDNIIISFKEEIEEELKNIFSSLDVIDGFFYSMNYFLFFIVFLASFSTFLTIFLQNLLILKLSIYLLLLFIFLLFFQMVTVLIPFVTRRLLIYSWSTNSINRMYRNYLKDINNAQETVDNLQKKIRDILK